MFALVSVLAAASADTLITLDPLLLTLLGGALIPLFTSLVTKVGASSLVRALISLLLSAVVATLVQINNSGGTFYLKQTLVAFSVTFLATVASFLGFWQPVVKSNETVLPSVGIGPKA